MRMWNAGVAVCAFTMVGQEEALAAGVEARKEMIIDFDRLSGAEGADWVGGNDEYICERVVTNWEELTGTEEKPKLIRGATGTEAGYRYRIKPARSQEAYVKLCQLGMMETIREKLTKMLKAHELKINGEDVVLRAFLRVTTESVQSQGAHMPVEVIAYQGSGRKMIQLQNIGYTTIRANYVPGSDEERVQYEREPKKKIDDKIEVRTGVAICQTLQIMNAIDPCQEDESIDKWIHRIAKLKFGMMVTGSMDDEIRTGTLFRPSVRRSGTVKDLLTFWRKMQERSPRGRVAVGTASGRGLNPTQQDEIDAEQIDTERMIVRLEVEDEKDPMAYVVANEIDSIASYIAVSEKIAAVANLNSVRVPYTGRAEIIDLIGQGVVVVEGEWPRELIDITGEYGENLRREYMDIARRRTMWGPLRVYGSIGIIGESNRADSEEARRIVRAALADDDDPIPEVLEEIGRHPEFTERQAKDYARECLELIKQEADSEQMRSIVEGGGEDLERLLTIAGIRKVGQNVLIKPLEVTEVERLARWRPQITSKGWADDEAAQVVSRVDDVAPEIRVILREACLRNEKSGDRVAYCIERMREGKIEMKASLCQLIGLLVANTEEGLGL